MSAHHSAPVSGSRSPSEGELLAEVACFEAHLVQLDESAGSACEQQVSRRRTPLAGLRRSDR